MGKRPRKRKGKFSATVSLGGRHLDQFTTEQILANEQLKDDFCRFQWEFYHSLLLQRRQAAQAIRESLLDAAQGPLVFSKWQRVIRLKHATEPLSASGSILNDPGGRFNVGALDPLVFPPIHGFYMATDRQTAELEYLCKAPDEPSDLNVYDLALVNPESLATVSLSGKLDRYINLNEPGRLSKFVDVIAQFSLPKHVMKLAKRLRLYEVGLVRTIPTLIATILVPNWRILPMNYDVPAQSQIFGGLVAEAGLEGIAYPSKHTERDCLVVYPQNFSGAESFIELNDEPPSGNRVKRLDAASWKACDFLR